MASVLPRRQTPRDRLERRPGADTAAVPAVPRVTDKAAPAGASPIPDAAETYLGKPIQRVEDPAILTGRGRYGDDLPVKAGTLHAAIVRSPIAHAEITAIDIDAALRVKGVHAVLTRDDIRAWSKPFIVGVKAEMPQWSLAMDRVRYVGEPVAVVIADSRAIAEDGVDLVNVTYKTLPPVTSIEDAMSGDAAVLHPAMDSNVVSDRAFSYGDPSRWFGPVSDGHGADIAAGTQTPPTPSLPPGYRHVGLRVHYPRNSCTPIECAVVIAEYLAAEQSYDVSSNFMGPFSLHAVMAMALKVGAHRLRHKSPRDSGGSFGVKQAVFPYVVLMCLASRKVGAPVKWVEDRLEHLSAATSATARLSDIDAVINAEGRIIALRFDQAEDCGGYLRAPEPATFYRMHGCLTGAYAIEHLAVRNRVVLTNKTPTGLVRGFGGPQVYFALERLMQKIARTVQRDPLDVYRCNFVPRDAFPYRAAAGALLDSGDYIAAMEAAIQKGDYAELLKRRDAARRDGRLYGIGFAAIVEPSISNMGYISTVMPAEARRKAGPKNGAIATATVSVDLLGGVTVNVASTPAGQGHMTVCAQVVADVLGLQPQDIVVNVEFDTQKDAWSVASGNYSSRFAGAVAGTVHLAAQKIRDKLARIAAAQAMVPVGTVRFEHGHIIAGDMRLPFVRFASNAPHWAPALLPPGESPGLRETVFWSPETLAAPDDQDRVNTSAAYGFAFDICGLEIDTGTGHLRIDRYVTAHDAGTLLNPALADGQIRGAFAQGLGAALMETFRYGDDGSFQTGTLADYLIPTTCEVPDPVIVHLETPSPFTPLGAKGLGEGNNMSTPVCIANALADALSSLSAPPRVADNADTALPSGIDTQTSAAWIEDIRLPLTPSRVMDLLGIDDPAPSQPAWRHGDSTLVPSLAGAGASDDVAQNGKLAGSATPTGADDGAQGQGRRKGGKALTARGSVNLDATPEAIFQVLLDPTALAKVIPGCHALTPVIDHDKQESSDRSDSSNSEPPKNAAIGPRAIAPPEEAPSNGVPANLRYRADVTVGIGMIKARYAAMITLSEIDPPHRVRLAGSGQSTLGGANGSGLVTLVARSDGKPGTQLQYDYTAEVSGKVAAVGSRMLEGAAAVVLRQLFEALGAQAALGNDDPASNGIARGTPRGKWRRLVGRLSGIAMLARALLPSRKSEALKDGDDR